MDKTRGGYLAGLISIAVNSALFLLKLWAGLTTGSLALTADAWHTLSDSLSSIVVVLAVKFAGKKADKEHPFGHGRWEQIAALFIAFFLGIIAFEFLKNSLLEFYHKTAVYFGWTAIIVTIVSIIVKELLARYAFYLGRKTGNLSVKADGWHHRTDAWSSGVVLIGILGARQFWWIDSVLGALVSLLLFYAAYLILREAATKLLGETPDKDLIEKITAAVKSAYPGDNLRLHHFHLHNYVAHQELTLHIRLDKDLSIATGHKIATDIERLIQTQFGMTATIHVEPLDTRRVPE
ncbi:MAG: cation diffusion facilitator family transporter [Candidatus Margulisbacteria bacterium]|jgi:cation diffusion facilitator family transporter|nr:cation diffusion facilitator family transporter [Candidatus Margulisiibacteriota bacterium]